EAGEAEQQFVAGIGLTPTCNTSPAAIPGPNPETPRQALARHIYCAAMLLATEELDAEIADRWVLDTTNLSTADQRKYRARRIAQWAVNVVDYRDGDSIMTRFLYDSDPFNGWDPDPLTNPDEAGE